MLAYSISQKSDEVGNTGGEPLLKLEPVLAEEEELVNVCPAQCVFRYLSCPHRHHQGDGQPLLKGSMGLLDDCEATGTGVVAKDPSIHVVVKLVK